MVETKGYKVAKGFKFNNDESIWNDMLCYFNCDDTKSIESYMIDNCDAITGWSATNGAISLNTTTKYQGTGAINFNKTTTSSTTSWVDKNHTSFDGTDQYVNVWYYIKDQTTLDKIDSLILLLLAPDSFSQFQLQNISPSNIGWSYVSINISDMTQVGSPDIADIITTRLYVITNNVTDTFTTGDFIMDYWHLSEASLIKDELGNATLETIGTPTYGTGKINNSIVTSNYNTFRFETPLKTERQYSFGMWKDFDDFGDAVNWATCMRGVNTGHMMIVDKLGSQGSVNEIGVYANGNGDFSGSGVLTSSYSGYHWLYVEIDNTGDAHTGETRFFIDNVLVGTSDRAVYDANGICGFLCYNIGNQSFGECDEIFIKNGFLTEAQRTAIYNSGTGISLDNTQTFPINSVSLDKYTGRKVFTDDSTESYVPTHTHNDSEEGTILSFNQMNMENMFKSLAYINYFQETNATINLSTQNYDDVSTADLNGINNTINTSATDAEYDTLGGNDGYISKINFTTYNFNDDNGNIARMVTPITNWKRDYSDHDDPDENNSEETIVAKSGNTEYVQVSAHSRESSPSYTHSDGRAETFSYYFPLLTAYNDTREFSLTSYTSWSSIGALEAEAGVKITFDGYEILNKGTYYSGGDSTEGTVVQNIKLVKEGGGNVLLYINDVLSYTSVTGCQTIDFSTGSHSESKGEDGTNGVAKITVQTYDAAQLTTINKPYLENPFGWYNDIVNDYPDSEDKDYTQIYTITYTDSSIKMDNNSDAYSDEHTATAEYARTDIMHIPLIDGEKRKLFLNTYVYASGGVDGNVYGKATLRIQANTTTFFNIVYSINDYTLSNTQYFYIYAERIGNTINYYLQDGTTLITTHSGTEGLFNIYTYTYERDEDPDDSSSAQTHVTITYPTNGYVDSIVATNNLVSAGTDINYAVVYVDYVEDTNTEVTTNIVNGSNRLNDVALGELIDVSDFSGNTNLEFNLKTTDSTKTAKFKKYSVVWY